MSMHATLMQEDDHLGVYRVEAVDGDGGCEVAIFSGPNALDRAIVFAGGNYYATWADPEGHSYDGPNVDAVLAAIARRQ